MDPNKEFLILLSGISGLSAMLGIALVIAWLDRNATNGSSMVWIFLAFLLGVTICYAPYIAFTTSIEPSVARFASLVLASTFCIVAPMLVVRRMIRPT